MTRAPSGAVDEPPGRPDLAAMLRALASWLVQAVDGRAALVTTTDRPGGRITVSAGPDTVAQALRYAAEGSRGAPADVLSCIGVSASFGERPLRGAVLAVVPGMDEPQAARVQAIVEAVAHLAGVCVEAADRADRGGRDALTQCLTRHAIHETLEQERARSGHSAAPLAIALVDLDDLARINEQRGHPDGDVLLCVVGAELMGAAGSADSVGRYSDDEFLVVMPGADVGPATAACARMQAGVAAAIANAGLPAVALSLRTAQWAPGMSVDHLIEEAAGARRFTRDAATAR